MSSDVSPFRRAALNAKKNQSYGGVLIVRPLSFSLITSATLVLIFSISLLLIFGTYSKRISVSGYLRPAGGFLRIYPPQNGVLTAQWAAEGNHVTLGEQLFQLSSERRFRNQQNLQRSISDQAAQRIELLRRERVAAQDLEKQSSSNLRQKIRQLESQRQIIESQIDGQRRRLQIAEENAERYQGLLTQNFVSREILQQKVLESLDHRDKLRVLERQGLDLSQVIADASSELKSISLRTSSQTAQLDRVLSSAEQELLESNGKLEFSVTAPQSGILSGVTVEVGQQVDTSRALANLTPDNATLLAELFATGRAVGLVREGDIVMLRLHAFPYQKFGHVKAAISTIAIIPAPIADLNLPFKPTIGGVAITDEPVYRITAKLQRHEVSDGGQIYHLKPGMLIDAEIFQEERRFWEWLLAPLKSLRTNVAKD